MGASDSSEIARFHRELEGATAQEVVAWVASRFWEDARPEQVVMTSSFGAQSAVMLHLVTRVMARVPVVLIDTGYLFAETYRFVEELKARFSLDVRVFRSAWSAAYQEAVHGKLWEQGEEGVQHYLALNKVEPMAEAVRTLQPRAWISGVRGSQTDHRKDLRFVEEGHAPEAKGQSAHSFFRVHPLLQWNDDDVHAYLREHGLPVHPLVADGYHSIGDVHSTLPTVEGQDPREGRILGKKHECGIHTELSAAANRSLTSSKL